MIFLDHSPFGCQESELMHWIVLLQGSQLPASKGNWPTECSWLRTADKPFKLASMCNT